ncbi:nuclear transport factor 2 family protein [Novosphingobium sp. KCTC 2891]|uniref:nuclear transport factor 2 family protein n=1 Tax=Novosphingobium sp. KCTC 2891 TaxID=2989730 RepID=UPI002221BCCE|nr:nuclear transport factor 2 family protein [Novosphingobium sp. KCTC 2891]MCW1383619.1 nuclear transport factor 2 family protein [Novosphingobium sp. KCTC 2891]
MYPDMHALQRLIDKDAIREASLRYTRGIDRHDVELALAAYHSDATDDHGTFIGDPPGFVRYANDVHARNWVQHQHYVTNQTIDLDGDTAHGETYFLATLQRPDGTVDLVGGRYVDRFDKREGCWAVADRACLVEWTGELPAGGKVDASIFLSGSQDKSDISYARPLRLHRPRRDLSAQD